jgi:hypothetical protein
MKSSDRYRLLAVALWFLGGFIDLLVNGSITAPLSMLSAVFFGWAILTETLNEEE